MLATLTREDFPSSRCDLLKEQTDRMRRILFRVLKFGAIASLLAACESSEFRIPASVAPLQAPYQSAPAQPARGYSGTEPLAPSVMRASWTEPAGVLSKKEAMSECQRRADQYANERGTTVVMINVVPAVKGWLCVFEEN